MSPWVIWLLVACAFAIAEMLTAGFMVLWFGVAALVALVISLILPEAIALQVVVWGIVSVILLLLTKKFADKINPAPVPTNVYSVIGKKANVIVEINGEKSTGQVKVDGDIWSAKTEEFNAIIPVGSVVEILKVDGVKVVVKKIDEV